MEVQHEPARDLVLALEMLVDGTLADLRPGSDLVDVVARHRTELFDAGRAALYVDLPLEQVATTTAAEQLEVHGVTFAGVFPNGRVAGDVLRLQCLADVDVHLEGISTASEHGARLLEYVVADLERGT